MQGQGCHLGGPWHQTKDDRNTVVSQTTHLFCSQTEEADEAYGRLFGQGAPAGFCLSNNLKYVGLWSGGVEGFG